MARKKNGQKRSTRHAALPVKDHGTWRIRWIDNDGKRRSRNFNDYDEAVAELERIKGDVRAIKDGRLPKQTHIPTFEKFVSKYWIPNRGKMKRSFSDDESMLRCHLHPAFGQLPLNRITTEKVEKFKADLYDTGLAVNTVRNNLACLSAILHYAHELDFLIRLPKIKKPRVHVQDYAYLHSESDIRGFLNVAKEKGQGVHAFFATAVYTGMRAGELFGLRWSDVNFKSGFITVQRSFNKPTKSGDIRHVPIFDTLMPILKNWKLQNPNELAFPNEVGNMHAKNPRLVRFANRYSVKGKEKIKETKGVFGQILKDADLPRMRFHDLRHTFASQFVMKGGDLFKLQKILGHADQKMVQRYARLAPEAFDDVRGIFGEHEESTPKILKMKKKPKKRHG